MLLNFIKKHFSFGKRCEFFEWRKNVKLFGLKRIFVISVYCTNNVARWTSWPSWGLPWTWPKAWTTSTSCRSPSFTGISTHTTSSFTNRYVYRDSQYYVSFFVNITFRAQNSGVNYINKFMYRFYARNFFAAHVLFTKTISKYKFHHLKTQIPPSTKN